MIYTNKRQLAILVLKSLIWSHGKADIHANIRTEGEYFWRSLKGKISSLALLKICQYLMTRRDELIFKGTRNLSGINKKT